MEKQKFNLKKSLAKMKPVDFIYIGVIFVFIIIVVALFSYSTSFIAKNINKIFSLPDTGNTQALNMSQYSVVAKKLNLPVNTATENLPNPTPTQPATITPSPVTQTPIDKKSITINILNSTTKKGVASVLNKALTDAGFSSATTGNEKTPYAITTIVIKDSKKEYSSLIQEVLNKSYPKTILKTAATKTDFDVTIIIGKQ